MDQTQYMRFSVVLAALGATFGVALAAAGYAWLADMHFYSGFWNSFPGFVLLIGLLAFGWSVVSSVVASLLHARQRAAKRHRSYGATFARVGIAIGILVGVFSPPLLALIVLASVVGALAGWGAVWVHGEEL
ncbi:hypothetical protein CLV30_109134 [Haloactinopolyspora alba]|uniref:Uncharacterized protein n=1 Tax=Haloactinopolyspora alba TaxID=648780 RepID=A0A2P8E027_9ACTN|nr:hypothetical protein [Haloactinopolyspora alba]PSL02826.1 hypothetical protein CLV30_109134 [Haloactinopolyspora alba]